MCNAIGNIPETTHCSIHQCQEDAAAVPGRSDIDVYVPSSDNVIADGILIDPPPYIIAVI